MTASKLMNIMELFLENSDDYSSTIIQIENCFHNYVKSTHLSDRFDIVPDPSDVSAKPTEETAKMQILSFKMAWNILLENISRGSKENRLQALMTSMKLIKFQALLKKSQTKFYFPTHMLQEILIKLLHNEINNSPIIAHFQKYSSYNDILFHCWKVLPIILSKTANPSNIFINNLFCLINIIPLNKELNKKKKTTTDEVIAPKIFCKIEDGPRFKFDLNNVQKWMEQCWKSIMKWNLNGVNLQQAILVLIDNLISHLPNPVLLTDFLMNSMDSGGAISALALQGVFILMQKHNLEYPQVYNKLYNMYEPDLFFTKHKSRLLYLTDTFLSSTHLPEAMVAGFIKKFARLAQIVSPSDSIVLLQMISNLIIRHPGLKMMLDAKSSNTEMVDDPYNIDEKDPCLSRGIQSSLWEVADLRNHACPSVAAAAGIAINSHHATIEKPITDLLDNTEDDLLEQEFGRQYKQVYLATQAPNGLQDKLSQYWQLF